MGNLRLVHALFWLTEERKSPLNPLASQGASPALAPQPPPLSSFTLFSTNLQPRKGEEEGFLTALARGAGHDPLGTLLPLSQAPPAHLFPEVPGGRVHWQDRPLLVG